MSMTEPPSGVNPTDDTAKFMPHSPLEILLGLTRKKNRGQEKHLSVPGFAPERPRQIVIVLTATSLRREPSPKDF